MASLTLVMPYYENPGMLAKQYTEWERWPAEVQESIMVILVDDGSQLVPADRVNRSLHLPGIQIWRVDEDRPWHQHAARNLGAHVAPDGWLLMTDMDHILTAENAESLLRRLPKMDAQAIYTLHRVEADTGEDTLNERGQKKPHPNSFVLTRELYWRIGGYDEDYCGVYGTDSLFKRRAFAVGRKEHLKKVALVRYWRDLITDASTNAPRKEGRDPNALERIRAAKIARGEPDTVKVLQFKWERVL